MRPSIAALTSLRFFAALVVVLFHYNLGRPESSLRTVDFGYQAVTFFFVLSGFVLAYAHGIPDGGLNVSPKTFLKARLLRICPAYYLAILMIVLLFFVAGIVNRIKPIQLFLVLTMSQSWTPTFALSINPPAWSLSNEMCFYFLFPALWRVTNRMGLTASMTTSTGLILLAAVGREMLPAGGSEVCNNFRFYSPIFNIPQFILGVSLGYAFITSPWSPRAHAYLFWCGTATLVAFVVLRSTTGWSLNGLMLDIMCGSIIFGAAGSDGLAQEIFSWRLLVLLGEASYATYILHFPIWLWWNHYTKIVYKADWSLAYDFAAYMSVVSVISVVVLVWMERPARRALRS